MSSETIRFPFDTRPETGQALEVADGVFWVRMPIPIPGLEYINLWLLRDDDGWTIVDTGLGTGTIREAWESVFAQTLDGRPVKRVICTHFHPDHLGQAGWLTERWDVGLWMTLGEWTFGRMLALDAQDALPDDVVRFYRRAGFGEDLIDDYKKRGYSHFQSAVTPIPRSFRRIVDGEAIIIGGHEWRVMVGRGHSPEHACLYCADLKLLISGDQVLPNISPHIGVYPGEPDANPLGFYLDSLPTFKPLPDDTLTLPAHNDPFFGLHARLDSLAHHHDTRLDALLAACAEPQTALTVLPHIFRRKLEGPNVVLATGEGMAHLHYLMGRGLIGRELDEAGVYQYRTIGAVRHFGDAGSGSADAA